MDQHQAPTGERPRVLRRSKSDRMIAGVCGGLGRYLGVDPVLLRIAFVVLALAGGGGLLAYIVAWILIPEEGPGEELGEVRPSSGETLRLVVGGVLIVLGALWLLDVSFPRLGRFLWPLALIAVGVGIIVQSSAGRR